MLWTQDQAVSFECARETMTELMAVQSARIAAEEAKPSPDVDAIAAHERRFAELAKERGQLTVEDEERNATVRRVYGAQVQEARKEMAEAV